MSDRIRRLTTREVDTILRQCRFQLISQKGSYRKCSNEDVGLQVTVPYIKDVLVPIANTTKCSCVSTNS